MSKFDLNSYPLWTALITPFTEQEAVDYECLAELVSLQESHQNGILLLGSTGEGLALDIHEQKNIVDFVVALNPTVPIMVTVGGFNLQQQFDWIDYCNQLEIDALLLASPLYAKPGKKGQQLWFSELLSASSSPCMIYNVPSRSGVDLDPETLSELSQNKNFWALKEASGNLDRFHQFRKACPEVRLYSGDDGLFPQHVSDNAAGLVSVVSNVWPQAARQFVNHHLEFPNKSLPQQWEVAADAMFCEANPIPVKALMYELDMINTPYLRPPLTHLELTLKQPLLIANQLVNRWLNEINETQTKTEH